MEKNVNINLANLAEMICPRCKSKHFIKTFILKHVPPLMAGNQHAMIIGQELFACSNCFYVINQTDVDQFRPGKVSLQEKTGDNSMTFQKDPTDTKGNPL